MKKLLIVITLVLALAVPLTAFAATSSAPVAQAVRSFCGIDTSKLTTAQKADLTDQFKKQMELKKETINKMVSNGSITKEQGAAYIKNIDDMIKYHNDNGFTGGMGMGRGGRGGGCGMGANGCTFNNTSTN